eukprot:5668811-Pleurochrysis_carterae.AAC.2
MPVAMTRAVGGRLLKSDHTRLDVRIVEDVSCSGTHLRAAPTRMMSGARAPSRPWSTSTPRLDQHQ